MKLSEVYEPKRRRAKAATPLPPVAADQRYSRAKPCPICGGHPNLPPHKGVRCHGWISSDGRYAFCSQKASDTEINSAYRHANPGYVAPSGPSNGQDRTPDAVYSYTDENGKPLYEVVRFPDKRFRQRKPDGTWGTKGIRRVLYRLPEVLCRARTRISSRGRGVQSPSLPYRSVNVGLASSEWVEP